MREVASASAPGKIILFGEHAVVYGQPAIAVPVNQVQAAAVVEPQPLGAGLTLVAPDLGLTQRLKDAPVNDPLAAMAHLTLRHLGLAEPDARLTVRSTIPISSGLGSGTAVSTAIVRALSRYFGQELGPEAVTKLVYEVEKLHHGTPSGIDNTVVAYEMPVFFQRGAQIETFAIAAPLHLVIADTGIASPTHLVVGDLRRRWEQDRAHYERVFGQIGDLVARAKKLIEVGHERTRLGTLMTENHRLLRRLDVSSPELERLVEAARRSGALGAKLSGAGRGGNLIALVEPGQGARVAAALEEAGAVRVFDTIVPASARVPQE
jgi:mevalonate kinase